ncbi:replication protein A 32 kDa subunit A-like [Rutidosis leptorrhynchoides]|uniref:replication protein A 32 kDa subunit A-like n=1 Tax=Rutidosis leptorrhynchoides TaxID=125765 RepID=UPI003A995D47
MSYSQFDGNAVFSGGGFMPPSQATQNTESAIPVFSKNRETQTLIPLTVNQILKASQSNDDKVNLIIDGVDVNNVRLVGMVCNKIERVTDVSFHLDDGTGDIECNRWVHDPIDTKEMDAIMDGMYVRVHGQLKSFQGKRQMSIFGIKPVTDFNEITHHFVECIYVHSHNTKLMKQQQPGSSNQGYTQSAAAVNTRTYQTTPSNQYAGHYAADGIKDVDKMVRDYLMLPASLAREEGVHEQELVAQLNVPLDKIRTAVQYLVGEGFAYTTIDDVHVKCTANG